MLKRNLKEKKTRSFDKLMDPIESYRLNGFDATLTLLWRQMVQDLNIEPGKFNTLLDIFIRSHSQHLLKDYDYSSVKGNWMKAFTHDHITWRTMMKAFLLLRIRQFTLTITADYMDRPGVKSAHSVTVNLSSLYDANNTFENIYTDARVETVAEQLERVEKNIAESLADQIKSIQDNSGPSKEDKENE